MVSFDNRLRLIEQHIGQLDADVIGISEVDGCSGENHLDFCKLMQLMQRLGYDYQYAGKASNLSGSAVFYKRDKILLC
jgi:mRNA deadenylase 3'-5' endonuclease subunit Ccr4